MASPLRSGKQSVNLSAPGLGRSKIRRDPPPVVKEVAVRDRDEVNRQAVIIGVVAFALALVVIAVGFTSVIGWSPRQYNVQL